MVIVPSLVREIRTLVEIQNFTKRGNGTFDPKTSQSTDKLLNNKMKCRNMEKKTQSDIKILMWISTCKIRLLALASALRDFLKYLKKAAFWLQGSINHYSTMKVLQTFNVGSTLKNKRIIFKIKGTKKFFTVKISLKAHPFITLKTNS